MIPVPGWLGWGLLPAGLALLLHLFHRRLRISLAAPRVPIACSLDEHGVAGETVTLPTRRGRMLAGWWLPATPGRGTVVVTHGWGANR